ncbi:MAG: ATPase [Candidatus Poribacteria bacterium]|nr:MAG: ATPase [Candidatus Poribacteria bacterium]
MPNGSELRVLVSWSSGKDSAWTLYRLRDLFQVRIVGLITTLNRSAKRVAMHAVREELVEAQAQAVGLPLRKVWLPAPCSNAEYERLFGAALQEAKAQGVQAVAFGDLFLEDVRAYRERLLESVGLMPLFPLWGQETHRLAQEMLEAGLEAYLTCVDPQQMDPTLVGCRYDTELLRRLPPTVDPCGERGEFHTFAAAGPMFAQPIRVSPGEIVCRDGFVFADLLPQDQQA